MNCEDRIQYAVKQGMLPEEVLEKTQLEDTKKQALCSIPGCEAEAKTKGLCQRCYAREWARNNKKKVDGSPKKEVKPEQLRKTKQRNLRLRLDLTYNSKFYDDGKQIIEDLEEIANKEFRHVSAQALIFLKEGINKWKVENKQEVR